MQPFKIVLAVAAATVLGAGAPTGRGQAGEASTEYSLPPDRPLRPPRPPPEVEPAHTEQLNSGCDGAVRGRVIGLSYFEGSSPWGIIPFTRAQVRVTRRLRGVYVEGGVLSLTYPGGLRSDGRGLVVSSSPRLSVGDDIVTYLGKFEGAISACSGSFGVFVIDPSGYVKTTRTSVEELESRVLGASND